MFDDKEFEKLKAETFDILCGVGGLWQPFEEIAAIHLECDGVLDKDKLRIALNQLVAEGKIEYLKSQEDEEYRWIDIATQYKLSVGELPIIQEADFPRQEVDIRLLHEFLWAHIRMARSASKKLPLKPHKKSKFKEYLKLKRNLEIITHHCRYALAYMEKL